jgi:hypothetical protein
MAEKEFMKLKLFAIKSFVPFGGNVDIVAAKNDKEAKKLAGRGQDFEEIETIQGAYIGKPGVIHSYHHEE